MARLPWPPHDFVCIYEHNCPYQSVVGAGPNEIPNALIGPVAKSTAGYLRYDIGISYRLSMMAKCGKVRHSGS